jgi:hypothetical protein
LAKYYPLEQPVVLQASRSDLLALSWRDNAITADFTIVSESQKALRVHFQKTEMIRVLDEMPISTEEENKDIGLVSEHFAYLVEDSLFWNSQSEAFRIVFSKVRHYRFITGSNCLDVISDVEPCMSVVMRWPNT